MLAPVILIALLPLTPLAMTPPPGSSAEPSPDAESSQHDAIYLVTGLGTPQGFFGFEAVHRVGNFEIAGGAGIGLAADASLEHPSLGDLLQWSVMPRAVLGNEHGGATLGVGLSGGNYSDYVFCVDDCPLTHPTSYFVWMNFELGAEVWTPVGFAVRVFGGYAHGWCTSSTCATADADLPYFGIGVGYAF